MSTKGTLNIGLIGCGFMGRAHSNAFAKVNQFFELEAQPVLKAVCARNPAAAEAFAANWGYESFETDWRDLIRRPDIDLIDIASPNDTHAEIAIAAAEAGKTVMCEKPLGRNVAEAQRMVAAVEAGGHPNMVWYNYRRVPAVTLAKQLIDEGFSCSGSAGRFVLPRRLRFCGDSIAERSPRRVAQSKRPSARHSKLQTVVVEQSVRPR